MKKTWNKILLCPSSQSIHEFESLVTLSLVHIDHFWDKKGILKTMGMFNVSKLEIWNPETKVKHPAYYKTLSIANVLSMKIQMFTVISAKKWINQDTIRYLQKYVHETIFSWSKNRKIAKSFNFTRFF